MMYTSHSLARDTYGFRDVYVGNLVILSCRHIDVELCVGIRYTESKPSRDDFRHCGHQRVPRGR